MKRTDVTRMLVRLGDALSAGDVKTVAKCWGVPALVLQDQGSVPVSDKDEIERFFNQAVEWYRSRGLIATRPEIEKFEILGENLASVDVRWPAFDEEGEERESERSHYIVSAEDGGEPRIRVALTRTA